MVENNLFEHVREEELESPGSVLALYALGMKALRNGDLEVANAFFLRALEQNPNDGYARSGLVAYHYAKDELKEAEELALGLLQDDPGDLYHHRMLCWIYVKQYKHEDAKRAIEQALSIDPTDEHIWETLLFHNRKNASTMEQIEACRNLLSLNSDNYHAHLYMG
ncbi:MAG: tetratricopeptide repeat protein, partial [Verrucomicrobiota bacterium]